jgi:hypothetical protein
MGKFLCTWLVVRQHAQISKPSNISELQVVMLASHCWNWPTTVRSKLAVKAGKPHQVGCVMLLQSCIVRGAVRRYHMTTTVQTPNSVVLLF